ncbi:MAG: hypothetical protein ACLTW9_00920 [Enterocloster sp.]
MAAYNETCIGALRYCRDHNIPIPETLSIVAPCNVNLYDLFYVQLTYALPGHPGFFRVQNWSDASGTDSKGKPTS